MAAPVLSDGEEDIETMALMGELKYGPYIRDIIDLIRRLGATRSGMLAESAKTKTDDGAIYAAERFTLTPDEPVPDVPVL